MENSIKRFFKNPGVLIALSGFVAAVIMVVYLIIYNYHSQLALHETKEITKLESIAKNVVQLIDGEAHKRLFDNFKNKDAITDNHQNKDYAQIHQILKKTKELNNLSTNIYTLVLNPDNQSFAFGVSSAEIPFYKHLYESHPKSLVKNYYTGGVIRPYKDEHGTWLSAFYPIKDSEGLVVAVVQIDEHFDRFIAIANKSIIKNVTISSLFILIFFIIIFFIIRLLLKKERHFNDQLINSKQIIEEKNTRLTESLDIAKIIQKKLIKSEHQNRLLFDENPYPMLIYCIKNLTIMDVNNTMISKYGYTKEEFLSMKITQLRPKEDIAKVLKDVDNVKNGIEKKSEWVHVLKNGEKIDVKVTAKSIKYSGEEARLVSIDANLISFDDVTESNLVRKELVEAKKMAEEAKKHQSQFLSNMSHEIRTPMNGVLGMTRLLKKTKQTKDQRKFTDAIYTSADNLMVIINEILDFSKIEAGKLKIESIPFNLNELSNIWKETLKIAADEKKLDFDINISKNVFNNLLGDPVRLNQIIYNLGGNAIKFTKTGKVVINISVKEQYEGEQVLQFDVEDKGIGIPKDKLESIFSSFSQASTTTTREYGGTGLGLSITKQLVELQAGKLWVESELNKGSVFSFTLPYKINTEVGQEQLIKEPVIQLNETKQSLGKLSVLLVEDHDINQLLATTVLEGWDFIVDLAEDGLEAVQKIKDNKYDVILMDIHMPKMDGYQATVEIRNTLKNNTPIIALTASARISDNQKCFDVGMNDFLSKPFDPEILLEKITEQIEKK